jgi:hypothetical protein
MKHKISISVDEETIIKIKEDMKITKVNKNARII